MAWCSLGFYVQVIVYVLFKSNSSLPRGELRPPSQLTRASPQMMLALALLCPFRGIGFGLVHCVRTWRIKKTSRPTARSLVAPVNQRQYRVECLLFAHSQNQEALAAFQFSSCCWTRGRQNGLLRFRVFECPEGILNHLQPGKLIPSRLLRLLVLLPKLLQLGIELLDPFQVMVGL